MSLYVCKRNASFECETAVAVLRRSARMAIVHGWISKLRVLRVRYSIDLEILRARWVGTVRRAAKLQLSLKKIRTSILIYVRRDPIFYIYLRCDLSIRRVFNCISTFPVPIKTIYLCILFVRICSRSVVSYFRQKTFSVCRILNFANLLPYLFFPEWPNYMYPA